MLNLLRRLLGPSRRELRAEIERLTKLMSDPKLIDLGLERGGALRIRLEPCIGAKVLAASFAHMLGDPRNWRAVEIGPMPTDNGMIPVTARRAGGDTPEASCGKACDLLAELRRVVAACDHRPHVLTREEREVAARVDAFLGIRSEETVSAV